MLGFTFPLSPATFIFKLCVLATIVVVAFSRPCSFAAETTYRSNYNFPADQLHVNSEAACKFLAVIKYGTSFAAVGTWNSDHSGACFTEGYDAGGTSIISAR